MRALGIRRPEPERKSAAGKNRADKLMPYVFLCVLILVSCWIFVGRQGVFGAKVDWLSQHSVFPDYFRQQFYKTGNLFPEFAGNLGGGQNIYNFSYYGLYSPIFLLSYLLPFVKMGDYLMAVSQLGILASASLLYYWLGRKGFSRGISLSVSSLFILAGPVIFHSCRQVMFVNYMPFLVMALIGVDRYFEKGRSGLYVVSVFLMIMASFYFSIGGMMVLALYGFSEFIELKRKPAAAIRFFLPMLTAVLMSGFFLAPTACAILGKRGGSQAVSIKKLFMPELPLESLVHGGYGIGLTTGVITVLVTGIFYRKWSERLLHGGCLLVIVIPVFQWLLNGGLYVRGKVLIPFLPLLCYLTAVYLKKQKSREIPFGVNIAAYLLTIVWLLVSRFHGRDFSGLPFWWYLILAESILLLVCFCAYWRCGNLLLLTVPSALCLFIGGSFFYNGAGGTLDETTYEYITDERIGGLIDRTLAEEDGFWRLEQGGGEEEKSANLNRIWNERQWISSLYSSAYHTGYQNFRKDIFEVEEPFRNDMMQAASDNPLYQKLMGVKYVVERTENRSRMAASGYEPYLTDGEWVVYKSDNTAPIAYATDKVVGEREYDSLKYPGNQVALMKYAVVADSRSQGDSWKSSLEGQTVPVEISLPEIEQKDLKIDQTAENAYHVQAGKKERVVCKIGADTFDIREAEADSYSENTKKGKPENGKLIFLRFQVKNYPRNQDVAVWLNGTRNKLSAGNHTYYNGNTMFTYVVALEAGTSEIQLDFGKGDYEISDVGCYLGDSSLLEDGKESEEQLYQSLFEVNWENTKGNRIEGKIQVQNTGYFITSIPYDDGFEIFVDGKRTVAEKVNKAFLGCSIREGEHKIEILYHAPGAELGKELACIGFLLFLIILTAERYKRTLI